MEISLVGGIHIKHYLFDLPGKNGWKRYLLSSLIILVSLIAGSLLYGILSVVTGLLNEDGIVFDNTSGEFVGMDPTLDLLFMNLTYVIWMLGIWLSIRFVHKRKLKTLITANDRINWKQIFGSFTIYFGLMMLLELVYLLIFPEHFAWNEFELGKFLFLFFVVLLLTPIQTTVEELIFRGFLLQWIGKIVINPIVLGVIMAIVFGSLHFFNPEMERSAIWVGLDYLLVGFMLTFLAVKMGSSELSIGAHAANNMFLFWFIGDPQSVGGSVPSLTTVVHNEPAISLVLDGLLFLVFYIIVVKRFKPNAI